MKKLLSNIIFRIGQVTKSNFFMNEILGGESNIILLNIWSNRIMGEYIIYFEDSHLGFLLKPQRNGDLHLH